MDRNRRGSSSGAAAPAIPRSVGSRASAAVVLLLATLSCSVNPATGNRQLNLVSEAQEIAMGRENDPLIVEHFGLYPDEQMQSYVSGLGLELARVSERPDLPWTFRVLDDPLVNAFALPGGFIYVTRGLMGHLNSEAELAGVLGHEIGHVTARHSASQMSKGILAQIGLVAGAVLAPEAAQSYGGLAQSAAQLVFLKFGRDDERQADALGVRYAVLEGFDPNALLGVFETLGRASQAAGGGGPPGWASTHPSAADRTQRIAALIDEMGPEVPPGLTVNRDSYLRRLDGMTFGNNPREGFFRQSTFYHPELAFEMHFPAGWRTQNSRQAVGAIHPENDAVVLLGHAPGGSIQEAKDQFFAADAVFEGSRWNPRLGATQSTGSQFGVRDQTGQIAIQGWAVFLEHGGQVLRLLGYARYGVINQRASALRDALASFTEVRDPAILGVQPMRIEVFRLASERPFATVPELTASAVPIEQLALINRSQPGDNLPAGTLVKTIRGTDPTDGPGR